ncbi:hypothetical protein D3C72_1579390 [compost metagenome]
MQPWISRLESAPSCRPAQINHARVTPLLFRERGRGGPRSDEGNPGQKSQAHSARPAVPQRSRHDRRTTPSEYLSPTHCRHEVFTLNGPKLRTPPSNRPSPPRHSPGSGPLRRLPAFPETRPALPVFILWTRDGESDEDVVRGFCCPLCQGTEDHRLGVPQLPKGLLPGFHCDAAAFPPQCIGSAIPA